jgi:methionyl-tRNA formyltransferase
MKITVFTSNQPRHISLIRELAKIADTVYAVIEVVTLFPGQTADFYKKSEVMQNYFSNVLAAEREVFGNSTFLPANVRPLVMKGGDLNRMDISVLKECLSSDEYIIFGASFIKEPLIDLLIAKRAYNIHMGVSPYYRGSSCNFWAAYDGNLDMVGATIHLLSKGLDSGDILFHALPKNAYEPFLLGMKAVSNAHKGLIAYLMNGKLKSMKAVKQSKSLEIRYTRSRDFTDEAAQNYLCHLPSLEKIKEAIEGRDLSKFLNPYIGE